MMLILLAGLQGRPLDVIEAARIDGASSWQVFRYMTFPHLRRYLELAALLGSIYETFYQGHDYGLASTAGVIVVVGTIAIKIRPSDGLDPAA
jgi:sorbitol/mannitol transport system permease protein